MGLDDAGKCLDERNGRVEHGRPLEPDAFVAYDGPQLHADFADFRAPTATVHAELDEELLKEITPLPWRLVEMDNAKVIPSVRLFGRRGSDRSKETCFGRLDTARDARYALQMKT